MTTIDIEAILTPIPGDNPAGESLRYEPVYDEIKEAKRADDPFDRGEWQQELKTSDWEKVISLSVDALTQKTKDIQITVWLTEALIMQDGFDGLLTGFKILTGFLKDFWDHVYPEIDDGDLDYRVGPLEYLNEKVSLCLKQIPVTDPGVSAGYSWLKWQESRQVGYDKDTVNQYGDVDEGKKNRRDQMKAEGKLTAEDFDSAVAASSKSYYVSLSEKLASCLDAFKEFDETVDEKFGNAAPRLAEFRQTIEESEQLVSRYLKEKTQLEPDEEPTSMEETDIGTEQTIANEVPAQGVSVGVEPVVNAVKVPAGAFPASMLPDSTAQEQALWKDATQTLQKAGVKTALGKLLTASCSAASVREQNRYRLLIAKLCLQAGRPDLARPIVEQLHALIEELSLERWESPIWIAEVLEAYYQCLTSEGANDDDIYKANNELFQRLCTKDITKAMMYKK